MIHARPKWNAGVTLIELLVVVAIAAILAQASFPDISDIMKNNSSTAQINELRTSLAFARIEAVNRNSPVAVCKSVNGSSCQDVGDMWQEGWIVFVDHNDNGALEADQGDEVLSRHSTSSPEFSLTFNPPRVAYEGLGTATQGANGTYVLCDDRGATHAKGVIVRVLGWPRLAVDSDANGIVEDANGLDLVCPG
jgi:type IV fimbrial biogenesis protein FimT